MEIYSPCKYFRSETKQVRQSIHHVFIGYLKGSKDYKFYIPFTRLIEIKDIKFFKELSNESMDTLIDQLGNEPIDLMEGDLLFDEQSDNEPNEAQLSNRLIIYESSTYQSLIGQKHLRTIPSYLTDFGK